MTVSESVAIAISHLESGRLGDELEDVEHLDPLGLALLGERALRPRAGRDRGDAPAADLGREFRLFDPQVRAGARAVGPLRDMVDVDEGEPRDRPQDLPRRLPDPHALVEAAR